MPMILARLEEHAIVGTDDLDRPASAALAQAEALGDVDGLAVRVRVPRRSGAGREVHVAACRREGADGVATASM